MSVCTAVRACGGEVPEGVLSACAGCCRSCHRMYPLSRRGDIFMSVVLDVRNLTVSFPPMRQEHAAPKRFVAVDDVSFTVENGTVTGIVGESGCGKTTLARSLVLFQKPDAGRVLLSGTDILTLTGRRRATERRKMQMIFQNPYLSLDPRMTAGECVGEALSRDLCRSAAVKRDTVASYLAKTGLDPAMQIRYPHEFSGGQRQRIAIARALAAQPLLLIADEPVSSLDVSVAAQILTLFKQLQEQLSLTMLFISHDLAVVRFISQNIIIMYRGSIVEYGETNAIFTTPLHPYTRQLLQAIPDIPESPDAPPFFENAALTNSAEGAATGCAFSPRCPLAEAACLQNIPELRSFGHLKNVHACACFKADGMSAR